LFFCGHGVLYLAKTAFIGNTRAGSNIKIVPWGFKAIPGHHIVQNPIVESFGSQALVAGQTLQAKLLLHVVQRKVHYVDAFAKGFIAIVAIIVEKFCHSGCSSLGVVCRTICMQRNLGKGYNAKDR
jgi:hypothetical protein